MTKRSIKIFDDAQDLGRWIFEGGLNRVREVYPPNRFEIEISLESLNLLVASKKGEEVPEYLEPRQPENLYLVNSISAVNAVAQQNGQKRVRVGVG